MDEKAMLYKQIQYITHFKTASCSFEFIKIIFIYKCMIMQIYKTV